KEIAYKFSDEIGRFFVQYNNVPMGAERVGDRVFVTIPRRRFDNPRYLQPPAIVVYDLRTDKQILRYQFKSSDLPANNTATGQSFTWNDGIFSVATGEPGPDGCRQVYFHPMVSNQEFSVSSCELEKREANQSAFNYLCYVILSFPILCITDLHVTENEVWVTSNTLPRFIYSRFNPEEYNFFVYKANVDNVLSGTVCEGTRTSDSPVYYPNGGYYNKNNNYS
ncbi:hypothetical protein HF086_014208, partial [Spodoptera exigua]